MSFPAGEEMIDPGMLGPLHPHLVIFWFIPEAGGPGPEVS